jgi:rhodanese-related sulfurtransferase
MTDKADITVREFIRLLDYKDAASESFDAVLTRSEAAKLVHGFIKKVIGEEDVDVSLWHAAGVLKDLYDCRVCVADIAEVYLKGIMSPLVTKSGDIVFALKEPVSYEEAKSIAAKTLDASKRTPVKAFDLSLNTLKTTDKETALSLITQNERAVLIDLRMPADFEAGHIKGAVNIPLREYVKNPYLAGERKDVPVIFFCEKGYKSEIAGNLALSMGYKDCYAIV